MLVHVLAQMNKTLSQAELVATLGTHRAVEMTDHDPAWSKVFLVERAKLAHALPAALRIEHIGSTSVPGLVAKPIIDIQLVLVDLAGLASDHAVLDRLGYVFRPSAFADDPAHLFFVKDTDGRRTHHLHVFAPSSPRPDDALVFRDYLVADAAAADRYARAKTALAALHPDSRGQYGQAKEPVVRQLLDEARRWHEAGQGASS